MRFVLLCFSTMTVLSLGTCFAAPFSPQYSDVQSIGKLHTQVPQKILDAEYAVRGEIVILGKDVGFFFLGASG